MKLALHILSTLLLMTVFSCQPNSSEVDPDILVINETNNLWQDTVSEEITLEELPVTIKEEIRKDELFQDLPISNITKITKDDFTYYDMTFSDGSGQLIMVFYDERGEIIVP